MWSIPLAGIGLLLIAMVLVRGQSFWLQIRSAIFGVFGILTYFLGPLLMYLGYLIASRCYVKKFLGKCTLLALMLDGVPVVFSSFTIHAGDTFLTIVRMLFVYGQEKLWSGGVFGGVFGGTLLALCGRPAANILMFLLFVVGVMVFFAVTPLDVVQFLAYQKQRFADAKAAREEEESAYDTQLFRKENKEAPIEDLTGQLPQEKTQPAARRGGHHPFDVEPYLEQEEKSRGGGADSAPAGQTSSHPAFAEQRPGFDVDLGPDAEKRQLEKAVSNDPLEPVVIGPGGTFGMDPLEELGHHTPVAPHVQAESKTGEVRLDVPQERVPENFEQNLISGIPKREETVPESELDAMIRSAVETGSAAAEGETASGTLGSLKNENDDTGEIDIPLPQTSGTANSVAGDTTVIPTIGGSFDVAKAAWNSGIPITDVLAGRQMPASAQSARTAPVAATQSGTVGNSEIQPVTSPPGAARAAAGSTASAGAAASVESAKEKAEPPKPYCYPSVNLFNPQKADDDAGAAREMKKNADVLVQTLDSFGVKTRILAICRGPSVTRYELQPQAGVKISRITNLADDIALNLATAGVRIEAPIPGKPAVGIEVPNRIRSAVSIRGVFESQNYINMRSPLTMALGKDIAGAAQVADLCKMPHLLIAGSTGSGKSVCVNSIIISFLFRSGPEDVKLILIDPKVVELAEYNGIPHLLMPVVTEPRKAAGALGASVAEMERRYKLFAENNVRDIKTYNRLAAQSPNLEHLPYIAIVIDELADLMMVAGKEVEDYICRIAQKARAAGIHLIIATQRPSVDVITGLIKANIPSRIAFAVSSQIDSRTILDSGGAEKLLGNGDMLFLPVGAPKPVRIQGTYVTDEEISAVLTFIKSTSSAQYDEDMIAEMERRAVAEGKNSGGDSDDSDGGDAHDAMFDQAVECVLDAGQASTSLLQRRCKLGYARAARIMDEMEQEKIIGPYEGAKPRAVLISRSEWQERKLNSGE